MKTNGTILVTGGTGFIGSHLIDHLLSRGDSVVCLDNLNDFYNPEIKRLNQQKHLNYNNYSFKQGDIRDETCVSQIFEEFPIASVIHLAAMAGVRPSLEQPALYTDVNILGTQVLLEAAVKNDVGKFLFASSSSVYGNNEKIPFSEDDQVDQPVSPYGATKRMGELLCYTYHHLYEIPTICLRFFTVYGPRQRPEMAIHKFVRNILMENQIPFYGDGNTARDYTYIDDIILGILQALESEDSFMIYNLGNSEPVTLSDLVQIISEVTGVTPSLDVRDLPKGDVVQTYADIERARRRLDYNPVTRITTGIRQFVSWYEKVRSQNGKMYS